MKTLSVICASLLGLFIAGCNGPKERGGAAKDKGAARSAGREYKGDSPAEKAGATADRIDRAQEKMRASQADALEDQDRLLAAQADAEADKLEAQAKTIRHAANEKANELDRQADALEQK